MEVRPGDVARLDKLHNKRIEMITMYQALEFYADATNWIPISSMGIAATDEDEGEMARDALCAKDISDSMVLRVLRSVEYVPAGHSPINITTYTCPVCYMEKPHHGLDCAMKKAIELLGEYNGQE